MWSKIFSCAWKNCQIRFIALRKIFHTYATSFVNFTLHSFSGWSLSKLILIKLVFIRNFHQRTEWKKKLSSFHSKKSFFLNFSLHLTLQCYLLLFPFNCKDYSSVNFLCWKIAFDLGEKINFCSWCENCCLIVVESFPMLLKRENGFGCVKKRAARVGKGASSRG